MIQGKSLANSFKALYRASSANFAEGFWKQVPMGAADPILGRPRLFSLLLI